MSSAARFAERNLAGRFEALCIENPYHVDRLIIEEVRRLSPASVLDVGCANGRFAASLNARVVGIEIDERLARDATGVCAHVILGDVENETTLAAAAEKGPYDLILAVDVVEHLVRPDIFLEQAGRLLNESGKFILCVPNLLYYRERVALARGRFRTSQSGGLYDVTHLHFYSQAELLSLLKRAKLRVERFLGAGYIRPGRRIAELPQPAPFIHRTASYAVSRIAAARPTLFARSFIVVAAPESSR